mgnify:CR=1 FL=1
MFTSYRTLLITAICLVAPMTAQAWDCDFYEHCCFQYSAAMQEEGTPLDILENLEMVCMAHRSMPAGQREAFCSEAWFAIGEEINTQYDRGIISYVPESCPQGHAPPDDWEIAPDPSIPDPAELEEE